MNGDLEFVVANFDKLRTQFNNRSDSEEDYSFKEDIQISMLDGVDLAWKTNDVLWLCVWREDNSYDGSALQVGVTRNGQICYEYQSHCSCYSWHNSKLEDVTVVGDITLLPEVLKAKNDDYILELAGLKGVNIPNKFVIMLNFVKNNVAN